MSMTRVALAAVVTLLWAVPGRAGAESAPFPDGPPEVDVLFVVDNSTQAVGAQQLLVAGFPRFFAALAGSLSGFPSVHIGVVSSDMGSGPFAIASCTPDGDGGALQSTARVGGCSVPGDRFIRDTVEPDGFTRVKNYSGTLEDTFACIAPLGGSGCGFEQHLESMKRALDGSQAQNAGFLRADAFLVVIIVADEDDCSAANPGLFNPDPGQETQLGPLTSFRCTEFGLQCAEGLLTRSAGSYSQCAPRVGSPFVRHTQEYVTFLRSLKADPAHVIVATVVGNPAPVTVTLDDQQRPALAPSCTSPGAGAAAPGVRLDAFARGFALRHFAGTLCGDVGQQLADIGQLVSQVIEGQAPQPPLSDGGPTTMPSIDGGPGGAGGDDDGVGGPVCGCEVAGRHEGSGGAALAALVLVALAILRAARYARFAPSPRGTRRSSRPST